MINSESRETSQEVNAESRQGALVAGPRWQWQGWHVMVTLGCILKTFKIEFLGFVMG